MAKTVPNNSFETFILRFTWTTLPHTRCSVLWQIMPKPMDYVFSRGEVAAVATGSNRYFTPRLPSSCVWNQTSQGLQMLSLLIEGKHDILLHMIRLLHMANNCVRWCKTACHVEQFWSTWPAKFVMLSKIIPHENFWSTDNVCGVCDYYHVWLKGHYEC